MNKEMWNASVPLLLGSVPFSRTLGFLITHSAWCVQLMKSLYSRKEVKYVS